jgi:O-antigen ligase
MIRTETLALGGSSGLTRLAELVVGYGPAAFIICLPLEFTSVWLHQQLSRLVLLVVAVGFGYLFFAGRRTFTLPRTLSAYLLGLYVLASLISWATHRAPGSTSSVADIALYPLVALLLMNTVAAPAEHRRAWTAFLVAALGVALVGAALYATHSSLWTPNPLVAARLNITFGDPNITARFLTLGAAAAVLMFAADETPAWLSMGTAAACAAVVPLTLSRSGLAVFPLTVLVAATVAFRHRRAFGITLVTLAVFALSTGINPETRQRAEDAVASAMSTVTGQPATVTDGATGPVQTQAVSADNRAYLIAAGLKMFKDHPVLGLGYGGYQHALQTTYRRFLPGDRAGPNLDTLSHASLVTVMAEQGIIGTLIFLAFFVALAWEAFTVWRRRNDWAVWSATPATLILPIFLYSQIEGRLVSEPYFWLALGLMYSAALGARRISSVEFEQSWVGRGKKVA